MDNGNTTVALLTKETEVPYLSSMTTYFLVVLILALINLILGIIYGYILYKGKRRRTPQRQNLRIQDHNSRRCSEIELHALIVIPCSEIPYGDMKRSAVQCSAVQCRAVQCSAVQCSAVQCNAVQPRT